MSYTEVTMGNEAFPKISKGIDTIANIAKVTLGPAGRTVLIQREMGGPAITKDGVTVAQSVMLSNPVEDMGSQAVKQISIKCNKETGDGTTSALVLAQALVKLSEKWIEDGKVTNVNTFKKGMLKAADEAHEFVLKHSISLDKESNNYDSYRRIALISSNGDEEVAGLIMEALESIQDTGLVKINLAKSYKSSVDTLAGLTFDNGMISGDFSNVQGKTIWRNEDALVFMTDFKINHLKQIAPVLEFATKHSRPLLILCDDIDQEALRYALYNASNGSLSLCICKSPGFGSQQQHRLKDIAIMTGGKAILNKNFPALQDIQTLDPKSYLGRCETAEARQHEFSIIGGKGDKEKIEAHKELVKTQIKQEEDPYLKEKNKDRLAKLTTGVAIIYVGAGSEFAAKEKFDRTEDALRAVKSTEEYGYIQGGGIVLDYFGTRRLEQLYAMKNRQEVDFQMDDMLVGKQVLYLACTSIKNQILENAFIKEKHKASLTEGVDVLRGGGTINYLDEGIIDPTKVVLSSLSNAVSICSTLITMGGTIHMTPEEYKPMI